MATTTPAAPTAARGLAVADAILRHARTRPSAHAIIAPSPTGPDEAITHAQLAARATALGRLLQDAAGPGGAVLLCAPNSAAYLIWFAAALLAGVHLVPLHQSLTAAELAAVARQADARAIIAAPAILESLPPLGLRAFPLHLADNPSGEPPRDLGSSTAGVVLQTSGTTGLPKLALRPAAALDAVARQVIASTCLGAADTVLAAIPLCHSYGVENGVLAPLLAGSAILVCDRFDAADAADWLRTGRATIFPAVPVMLESLAREEGPRAALRLVYSAGSPLPRRVADAVHERWGLSVGRLYGSSEVGSVTFLGPDEAAPPDAPDAAVGWPMAGVSIRILDRDDPWGGRAPKPCDEGQVAVRAPSMLSGYLGPEPLPLVDGHFLTGDLGRIDEAGRLVLTGRLRLLIDIGGMKVNPLEVESVLRECPGVAECVVLPLPLSDTINRLRAVIVPRPGGPAPSAAQIRTFARARLAPHKVPRLIGFRDRLPRSAAGKVLRHLLEAGA